jgi:UDP-glucose 4-epimerase
VTVLVTGGAGYIGSHACVELLHAGYEIVVIDNYSNSHPESLRRVADIAGSGFPSYGIDLMDHSAVENVFSEYQIDAVLHFAGLKAVGESVSRPLKYYSNNVVGSLVLFEVMQKFGVKRLVFSSSATVYGMQNRVPLVEQMPFSAVNPYGRTKMMLEMMLTDIVSSDPEWSVALLRYFNPVGAHESGRIGEDPNGTPTNLLPYITQVAVGKLAQLTVHGNDYPTPDGTCIRDYIHVMDLADGHVKALDYVCKTEGVEIFNLGTGNGCSVLEMVAAFEQATGTKVPYRIGPRRVGDTAISYADPTKANEVLSWKTQHSLIEMCRDAWQWQAKNPGGYAHTTAARL